MITNQTIYRFNYVEIMENKKYKDHQLSEYITILNVVEDVSGVVYLKDSYRGRYASDVRFVYYYLCKLFLKKKYSSIKCGQPVNRKHPTVLHGLKQFEYNYGKCWFLANDVYDKCLEVLNPLFKDENFMIGVRIEHAQKNVESLINILEVECELIN